jgi:hypothetical protein
MSILALTRDLLTLIRNNDEKVMKLNKRANKRIDEHGKLILKLANNQEELAELVALILAQLEAKGILVLPAHIVVKKEQPS